MAGVLTRQAPVIPAFVRVFVQMKIAVMRHSLREPERAYWVASGGIIGLLLALGTIAVALLAPQWLGLLLAGWLAGWVIGPIFNGGGDESLKPEYFAMLSAPPRAIAAGLFAASFAGVAPLVAFVAFLAIPVYAMRAGVLAVLVGLLAAVIGTALVVALSRATLAVFALLLRSRVGAVLAGVVNAFLLAFSAQGWAVIVAIGQAQDLSWAQTLVRWLPSGWGLAAVEAASASEWPRALGLLIAQALAVAALVVGWGRLLARRTGSTRAVGRGRRPIPARAGASAAVAAKELRTWSRDLLRTHLLTFALFYGLFFTGLPLAIGWTGMLPWAGVIFVVMAAGVSANLYGMDGSALWLTLLTPRSEEADVRGRQRAFLVTVAPLALVTTVALTLWNGETWVWPYVLGVLFASLGAASGLVVVVSVFAPVAMTDPHKRGANPLGGSEGQGELMGLTFLMLALVPTCALPALLVSLAWPWAGVPVGLAVGALTAWAFGRLAAARLRSHGPELLSRLRHGAGPAAKRAKNDPLADLPKGRQNLIYILYGTAWLPLFPQGLVPLVFKITGTDAKSWFLAMHVPEPWPWPVIIVMVALGLGAYGLAFWLPIDYRRKNAAPKVS